MNYIGSKHSLLPEIQIILDDHHVPAQGIALDLFAGTGAVAQLLKARGHVTYANDWQRYSYVTTTAFLAFNHFPEFEPLLGSDSWEEGVAGESLPVEIPTYSISGRDSLPAELPCAQVVGYLDGIEGKSGPFYEAYCQGGQARRMYFSRKNGLRIQAIRDAIEGWEEQGLLCPGEKAWLIACLIESADRVANTAAVYGAHLKHVKRSACRRMRMVALRPTPSPHPAGRHRVFCQDGLALLDRLADTKINLIYVDTPYNHRQYAANYHILETIARWDVDQFEPRGATGLREAEELRSDFCLRRSVEDAYGQLFSRLRCDYVVLSYNEEGLLGKQTLSALFHEFCTDVDFREIERKRFRADIDRANRVYKRDQLHEYLVLGRPR
jgi:adenine-specific DNA-methyltransferase